MDRNQLAKILEDVQNQGQRLLEKDDDPGRQISLFKTARTLAEALQPHEEVLQSLLGKDILTRASILISMDAGLFSHLSKSRTVSPEDLKTLTSVDPNLTARLFRHLAGHGILVHDGANGYLANDVTVALAKQEWHDSFKFWFRVMVPMCACMPQYFTKQEYKEPDGTMETAFQFAHHTNLSFFAWLHNEEEAGRWFANTMAAQVDSRRARWADPKFYPVKDRVVDAKEVANLQSTPILVDIGGGMGLDSKLFVETWPMVKGRVILQDLPEVLQIAEGLPPKIEKIPHNFYDEQPVRGARLYYMHRLLHDYPDEKCRQILLALKPAMKPGYSKIVIHEFLIPTNAAAGTSTLSDLMMMGLFGAKERTEESFRQIIESVGLKVTAVWPSVTNAGESVMEAILPENTSL